jgi:hypothetical protein
VAHFQRASDDRQAARRTQRANAASRQAQPVLAVSGMGFDFCGSSRLRMAFNAWVWGDSDRGSKSTSRRSAVIRTARSLSLRSSCRGAGQRRGAADPLNVALRLWTVSADIEAGERIVFRARQRIDLAKA